MSNTLTMEAPVGTINPTMGHIDANDVALYRAIGPDQPDPPSVGGTDRRQNNKRSFWVDKATRKGTTCYDYAGSPLCQRL
jgi:hypothetical protein